MNNFFDKRRPLVSVVMPAYNASSTILEAVQSALQQTLVDIEVVVCNDASTDDTLNILKSIQDPRLVVISNETNQGEGVTRDRAIDAAKGEWLAVLDADDVWENCRLEKMLSATQNEQHVMVFDDLLICHHTPKGLVPWRAMRGPRAFGSEGKDWVDVRTASWAGSYQFLIKPLIHANTLRNMGVKHSTIKFGADTEFFMKLIALGLKLRYVPGAYYHYRITPNSASANAKRIELMNGMLEKILPLFEQQPKVYRAIQGRIQYRKLLQYMRNGNILRVVEIFFNNPKVIPEFIHRAFRQMVYWVHRNLHSGSSR